MVQNPCLTLAGQSAPGDGVCLRNYPFAVATHDVVVRFLRSRLGDLVGKPEDCITLAHGASHVILDHCSAMGSIDECLSLAGNVSYATVQWCLIAEALDRSKRPRGPHGYGSLARANGPVSLHQNPWAHHRARNPRFGDNYGKPRGAIIDSQTRVGGRLEYRQTPPPQDSGSDGMPDAWESAHGLDPKDPADGPQDRDGDGYTNVEEYLNDLVAHLKP